MKKLLSVLLSIMMLAAVATSFAAPAFAAEVKSPSGTVVEEEGKDKDKSPSTGAAGLVLASTAAAGSALVLLKKKD